ISFKMDLYQPLYAPRPTVEPELFASLRPQTYEGDMDRKREALAAQMAPAPVAGPAPAGGFGMGRTGAAGRFAGAGGAAKDGAQFFAGAVPMERKLGEAAG